MNIEAEKIAIIKQILQLEDEEVFARLRDAVRKTLQLPRIAKLSLSALPDEEIGSQLREARQQAVTGEVLDIDEVSALAQQWRTK